MAAISPSWLSTQRVVYVTVTGIVVYFAFALWAPQLLTFMDEQSSLRARVLDSFLLLAAILMMYTLVGYPPCTMCSNKIGLVD